MRTRSTYFVTAKWVFDPAARRREKKAHALLSGAHDFLMKTYMIENGIDIDPDSWAAMQIIDRAKLQVADECARAQAKAKKADR